jgi:hypothetical protein
MVYLLLGVAAAALARALGVDWLDPVDDSQVIERISEFAVIVAPVESGTTGDDAGAEKRVATLEAGGHPRGRSGGPAATFDFRSVV